MSQPGETRYTQEHEWMRMDSAGVGVVGITHFAQEQLGDIVFIELPEVGRVVNQGEDVAVIESVKAAADCKAPASGTVLEVNPLLKDQPGKVNEDPRGQGWFFKLKLAEPAQFAALMDEAAYEASIAK
ncbi:MAG: glycine cleavage system protein GcvH [Burkholderiales bacterium]|nr:glycine cleavage system protein GcvH [Burkholderiales bacterium]